MAGKPVVVFGHNEAVSTYVKQYNLGIILEDEDVGDIKSALKEKIPTFSFDAYCKGRKKFIDHISEEQTNFEQMVVRFETQI